MKVLFFGCGQMGGAILKGVLDAGVVKNENILVYDASAERLTQLEKEGVPVEGAPAAALEQGELIILGIKPQVFSLIKENLYKMISKKPKVIVSIMAGVTLDMLKKDLGSQHTYIRTMPNLPLAIGQGATAISHEGVPAEIVQEVDDIFKSVGVVAHVSEGQMNAVTGVSGSGPAWAFEFIEGWIRGGVLAGLPRKQSEDLIFQTLEGCVTYLKESKQGTSDLTASVCSPGGTTIAGVLELEKGNFRSTIMKAVLASAKRSEELSN